MIVLIKILQMILALSLLIVFHELGHFMFAKLFKIRVDKFFLFFDINGIKLFSTKSAWFLKLFPKASSWETEYGIGWLPLGGYCKIAGMVDESMDLDSLQHDPQPWEFRTKAAWKRLLVMAGGVMNNIIMAVAGFILILFIWGSQYVQNDGNAVLVSDLAYEMGFRDGDRIIDFDGYRPENFSALQADLVRRNTGFATVVRGEDTLKLYIDHAYFPEVLNTPNMFGLAVPFVIDNIAPGSPNTNLVAGDRILEMDGRQVNFLQDGREILLEHAGAEVDALVLRAEDTLAMTLQVDSLGMIGAQMAIPGLITKQYSLPEAVPAGIKLTGETVSGYLKDLRLVATPSTGAYKSVGSFISIGQVFPSSWDWYQFLNILSLLSIMLAVMNLLPIPGLDGGHILFTLYEMVSGRKPGDKFLAVAQMIGMIFLMMLMVFACGNDIMRLL